MASACAPVSISTSWSRLAVGSVAYLGASLLPKPPAPSPLSASDELALHQGMSDGSRARRLPWLCAHPGRDLALGADDGCGARADHGRASAQEARCRENLRAAPC